MKLHLPKLLRHAVLACIAAVAGVASTVGTAAITSGAVTFALTHATAYADTVVYTSTVTGIADGAASFQNGSASLNGNNVDLSALGASVTGVTFSGSATGEENIAGNQTNGGYGGRVSFIATNTGIGSLTSITLNAGIEANLKNLQDKSGLTITVDNASIYGGTSAGSAYTFASNFQVDAGGVRLNGDKNNANVFTGSISGSGDVYLYAGTSLKVHGDVSGFNGSWIRNSNVGGYDIYFGNGTAACASGQVGGHVGSSSVQMKAVHYNYTGTYAVNGKLYAQALHVDGGTATFKNEVVVDALTTAAGTAATFESALTLNGRVTLSSAITAAGAVTLGDNVVFDLANLAAVDGVYTLFTNAVNLSGLDASNVSGIADGKAIILNANGTISVVEGTVGNRIWKNDGATNTWAAVPDLNWTADGADAFFVNGCTVQFGESATATGETIDMVGNLRIGGMTVNGTGWDFAGSGNIGAWGTKDAIVGSGELALGEGASVSFSGGGDLLFTGITAGSESTLKITGGTELYTRTASAISVPELELNNGTLSIVPQDNTNARLQVGVQALVTAGESILETRRSSASYAANVTVSSLSGSGTIKFRSGSQEGMATVFTIGGAANFSGEIHLVGNATDGGDRRVTLNLDSATVAQNAVVKFSSSNNKQNLQFGVGADGATVAGLDGSVTGNNSTLTIFSGKGIILDSAAAGDGVSRTLNIATTASTANWSTSATVLANLNLAKSGAGTQSFTGDLSAFNGTISVSEGVLNMSSIGSASSISLTSSGATLGVTGSTTPNSVNLTSGKSLSVVNGAVLNSALTLGGGTLTLGTYSSAWATDNGLSLNNHALVFGADKTELSLNLGSVAFAAGDTIDLFKDVASVELATGATLDTYFSGLDEALKTATLSLAEGRLVATLAAAYESSATIQLAMPANGTTNNGGRGSISAEAALTAFANLADGGYMFNNGGAVGTNAGTGEGILTTTDGVTSISLAPREGAGGTGEVIVLSANELNGYGVDSFTFSIASSSSADITGNIALTLAVIEGEVGSTTWSVLGDTATGSLTIGYGASITLDLAESITWSELYKVVAVMDNTGKELNGDNGALYTLEGISISAGATPPYYWESGTGNWSDAKWSTTDGATSGQTTLPTSGTVNVVFNNTGETASISIGTGVSVHDMSVTAGTYTFTGDENAKLDVAGKLTVGSGAEAKIKTAVEVGSIEVAGTLGISQSIKVAETGTVTLDAAGTINLQDFEPTTSTTNFVDSMNAFGTTINTYKVFDGGSISGTIGTWQIDGTTTTDGTFHANTGEYTIPTAGKIYGVGNGTVNLSSATGLGAKGVALNGGELVLDAVPTEAGFITATDKGGTLDLNGKTVAQSALGVLAGATVLEGNAASIYDLGAEKALASNLSLSNTDWKGTVKMGDIATPTEELDISSLGCPDSSSISTDSSSIKMGAVSVKKLTSSSAAAVQVDSLTLGAASEVSGALTLTSDTLTLGSADASLTAASLETTSGSLTIAAVSQDVLDALNTKASQRAVTILTLTTDDFEGNLTQNEIVVPTRAAAPVEKYFTELQWNATKTQLSYVSRVNPDYVGALVEASTQNGLAGVALLQQALQQVNPQVTAPDSALAAVLNAVDAGELSEEGAAAVAGAATAVLGMAAHGDLDRQLQAIRNRTTTMGVDQSVVHHDMPYFNAWINAEGDYSELSDDGTEGGYKLNSWGGNVGFDVDITPTFTAGMALTAMYGDLDVTGADTASGELNTYYVSAFARYCASAWTHTFVATAGLSDITLDRTVMGEEINGETDGVSFGLMYEVGRVFALDEDGTACLQPIFNVTWRHTQVNGYEESGSDLALDVDDQTLDTVTFGVGARLQAIVGESMYNRTSIFECRLLAKFDAGDRRGSSDVALAALGGDSQEVESAERGPIGLEAGAGLTIPLGDEGGSLFMDAAIELRADYTNVNGTVGYRINF